MDDGKEFELKTGDMGRSYASRSGSARSPLVPLDWRLSRVPGRGGVEEGRGNTRADQAESVPRWGGRPSPWRRSS